jgi:hypothetical protein
MDNLGIQNAEDIPKQFQILIEGKDALSLEEQSAIQARPKVQTHTDNGIMTPEEDFYYWNFDWDDRVRAYDSTIPYFVFWTGLSGIGVDDGENVSVIKQIFMYPALVFAAFWVVTLTPAKLLYTFLGLSFGKATVRDYTIDNWNTFISFFDAIYMVFFNPFRIIIDVLLLLPIDIILYLIQLGTWLVINSPILGYFLVYGWEIMFRRQYWVAMYIIFHFEDFKESTGGAIVWYYLFWWATVIWWYLNYMQMAFGMSYRFNDTGYYYYTD